MHPTHAYLITLKPLDSAPILGIKNRLAALGFNVVLVEGVRGNELSAQQFFRLSHACRVRTGRLMAPGELGCVLSHAKALRLAGEMGAGRHLILEDDFIASDAALGWILKIQDRVPPGTLLHLGGQEHMSRFYRYVRGKPLPTAPEVAQIYAADFTYLMCTVAYLVDTSTARAISELMAREPYIADDFSHAAQKGAIRQIWYRWVVSHPTVQDQSSIASDRQLQDAATKRHWTYRSRMNWARLWRHVTTRRTYFLKNQQPNNQLPD